MRVIGFEEKEEKQQPLACGCCFSVLIVRAESN